MTDDVARSNSLVDLATRIKAEHTATSDALKSSAEHAMAAGDLLIEAKAQVPHGQWLPWLTEHCAMSERTAQLYIRIAKNRTTIETEIRDGVTDLSLNQAAALLMLTSDVRKLLNFARDLEHLSGDEVIQRCITEGVAVISTPGYDPIHSRGELEKVEWQLFIKFLSYDAAAGRRGGEPQRVADHVEWILQRPFQNVAEWLGEEGDKYRKQWGDAPLSEQFKTAWAAFLATHRDRTLPDVLKEIDGLQQQFEKDQAAGFLSKVDRKRKRALRRKLVPEISARPDGYPQ